MAGPGVAWDVVPVLVVEYIIKVSESSSSFPSIVCTGGILRASACAVAVYASTFSTQAGTCSCSPTASESESTRIALVGACAFKFAR